MGEHSKIEWCDASFNPWVGCSKISPACDNCYAQTWAKRSGQPALWEGERRRTSVANWKLPLKWDAQALVEGRRVRVFCASLADVFDNEVDPQWRADLFELIGNTPHLDWLILTKRISNAHRMLDQAVASWSDSDQVWDAKDWPHVWMGATIANQQEFDRDVPKLLSTPAWLRFLSCEPLLGPIDISGLLDHGQHISWIIAGGESGPKARPSHPDWFRSLRDQCVAAGVAFHFKQWGEFREVVRYNSWPKYADNVARVCRAIGTIESGRAALIDGDGSPLTNGGPDDKVYPISHLERVGKKAAGRTLDGKVWDQFPELQL